MFPVPTQKFSGMFVFHLQIIRTSKQNEGNPTAQKKKRRKKGSNTHTRRDLCTKAPFEVTDIYRIEQDNQNNRRNATRIRPRHHYQQLEHARIVLMYVRTSIYRSVVIVVVVLV